MCEKIGSKMTSSPLPPPLLTDSTLLNKGSSQRFVTSQWLSRNVRTGPLAIATPSKRALTSPMGGVCMKGAKEGGGEGRVGTKPCLLGSRISFTFGIEVSSCPSMAAKSQDHNTMCHTHELLSSGYPQQKIHVHCDISSWHIQNVPCVIPTAGPMLRGVAYKMAEVYNCITVN